MRGLLFIVLLLILIVLVLLLCARSGVDGGDFNHQLTPISHFLQQFNTSTINRDEGKKPPFPNSITNHLHVVNTVNMSQMISYIHRDTYLVRT